MSFVRTGLPAIKVAGYKGPLEAQAEAPFLDYTVIDQDEATRSINRRQRAAGRWLDIAGACAITLCLCAWVAIRVAAG